MKEVRTDVSESLLLLSAQNGLANVFLPVQPTEQHNMVEEEQEQAHN